MAVLSYLPKLKMDLELTFGAHFLHGFFKEMFLIQYTINVISFFTFQDIKQNVLLILI